MGFVNDGTDDAYGSHAWYTFKDQITDIALCSPLHPGSQPPGAVIIQGVEIALGHRWTYHLERPIAGLEFARKALSCDDPMIAEEVARAEQRHVQMLSVATDNKRIREYLDTAPDGMNYAKIAAMVR